MAGIIKDSIRVTPVESDAAKSRDLQIPEAFRLSEDQATRFRAAAERLRQAVEPPTELAGQRGGINAYTPSSMVDTLRDDYLGSTEASLRVVFSTNPFAGETLGRVEVTPQNIERLITAYGAAADAATKMRASLAGMPTSTESAISEVQSQVERAARTSLKASVQTIR